MNDFARILKTLDESAVHYILVGGVAAVAHGAARLTQDIDVVYERSPENLARLVQALGPLHPYLRGAPPGLPFRFDVATIQAGLNFTLITDLGALDLLGEIAGGGGFQALANRTNELDVFGTRCLCLDLPTLIHVKKAAGRPKDYEAISELQAILDQR